MKPEDYQRLLRQTRTYPSQSRCYRTQALQTALTAAIKEPKPKVDRGDRRRVAKRLVRFDV